MFGFFGKKRRVIASNAVYRYRSTADAAIVRLASTSDVPVIIASFFPASLLRIDFALKNVNFEPRPMEVSAWPGGDIDGAPWLLRVNAVSPGCGFVAWLKRQNRPILFLFVEHFPMVGIENTVLDLIEAATDTTPIRVLFYAGLDEPLIRAFGGDRLAGLMNALGVAPDEMISHPMVDKAIANAGKKIEKQVRRPQSADSDADWFRWNLPKHVF